MVGSVRAGWGRRTRRKPGPQRGLGRRRVRAGSGCAEPHRAAAPPPARRRRPGRCSRSSPTCEGTGAVLHWQRDKSSMIPKQPHLHGREADLPSGRSRSSLARAEAATRSIPVSVRHKLCLQLPWRKFQSNQTSHRPSRPCCCFGIRKVQ